MIVADDGASASYVASDLLAQAEHSEDASAILLTTSNALALEVLRELEIRIGKLSRAELIKESLTRYGAIIVVDALEEACAIVNDLAPEHLQIMARDEEEIASRIRNAGAIFFGAHSPAAVGDYLAGPNHVLPSGGTARFSSGLSVNDFLKRTNTVKFSAAELQRTAPSISALAHAEGFDAHASSVLVRLEENT